MSSGGPGVNGGVVVDVLELFFFPEVGDEGALMDTERVVSLNDGFFMWQDGHYPGKSFYFSEALKSFYYTTYYCFATVIRGLQGSMIRINVHVIRRVRG